MEWTNSGYQALIGKQVVGLHTDSDCQLLFTLTDGYILMLYEGDCCSSSRIESIINPKALLAGPVLHIEDLDVSYLEEDTPQWNDGEKRAYGHKLVTMGGACEIAFINTSPNGYYGGYVDSHIPEDPDKLLSELKPVIFM